MSVLRRRQYVLGLLSITTLDTFSYGYSEDDLRVRTAGQERILTKPRSE
jgi:hypothetical protein